MVLASHQTLEVLTVEVLTNLPVINCHCTIILLSYYDIFFMLSFEQNFMFHETDRHFCSHFALRKPKTYGRHSGSAPLALVLLRYKLGYK